MFLHELVSEQTNKYGFFEYDAQTYKSSFHEHMRKLYQDISHCVQHKLFLIYIFEIAGLAALK